MLINNVRLQNGALTWRYIVRSAITYFIRVVAVTFPTDSLNFLDLTGLASSLDVFEMHISILAEVNDRSKEIEET